MRKIKLLGLLFTGIILLSGCSDILPQKVQTVVEHKLDETKSKAMGELQEALSNQLQEFISSTDLQDTLGLSKEEQEDVSDSLKEFLEKYDSDPTGWKEAVDAVKKAIEEVKKDEKTSKITKEELNKKLQEILDNK